MTHWIPPSEAWRSIDRSWSATLTIVVSSTDMIAPRITTIATRITCGSIRGSGAGRGDAAGWTDGVRRRDRRRRREGEEEGEDVSGFI